MTKNATAAKRTTLMQTQPGQPLDARTVAWLTDRDEDKAEDLAKVLYFAPELAER